MDAELSISRPRGWAEAATPAASTATSDESIDDGDGRGLLDGRDQPGHGLGAHPGVRGDLVHVEVQPVRAGDLLAMGERADVGGRGGSLGAVVEAPADRALDVLDLAGREVAGGCQVRVDREHEPLAVGRLECDADRAVLELDRVLAGPLEDAGGVDVLADDLERRGGTVELHECGPFSGADGVPAGAGARDGCGAGRRQPGAASAASVGGTPRVVVAAEERVAPGAGAAQVVVLDDDRALEHRALLAVGLEAAVGVGPDAGVAGDLAHAVAGAAAGAVALVLLAVALGAQVGDVGQAAVAAIAAVVERDLDRLLEHVERLAEVDRSTVS